MTSSLYSTVIRSPDPLKFRAICRKQFRKISESTVGCRMSRLIHNSVCPEIPKENLELSARIFTVYNHVEHNQENKTLALTAFSCQTIITKWDLMYSGFEETALIYCYQSSELEHSGSHYVMWFWHDVENMITFLVTFIIFLGIRKAETFQKCVFGSKKMKVSSHNLYG